MYCSAVANQKQNLRRSYPSLLAWRTAKGLSQREAAAQLGMTQASYSRFELGRNRPRIETLKRILAETGVPLEVMVGVA